MLIHMRTHRQLTLALFTFGMPKSTTFQFCYSSDTQPHRVTPESTTLLDRGTENRDNVDHNFILQRNH